MNDVETTYPLRAASSLTGVSPDLLRAWEKRYGVVKPLRTQGGTRRYRASDLERLRLVKSVVDDGERISVVARMSPSDLARRAAGTELPTHPSMGPVFAALERLDAYEAQRLMGLQLSAMGPVSFARDFALPLAREIGDRWADDRIGIASEHLATGILRSMLGSALMPDAASRLGPTIIFATPVGERHELGLQSAALTAMGAGANALYLGADLPVEDLVEATKTAGAAVLALSVVAIPVGQASHFIGAIRDGLGDKVRLWVGGPRAAKIKPIKGVEKIGCLEELESRVALLRFENPSGR